MICWRRSNGIYRSSPDMNDNVVPLLVERERKLRWLRAELAIGEELERRGDVFELTRERFAEIKRRAFANARDGKPIKDAVKP